ncbi:MAG: lactate utilization protein [Peptoniphilus sp.]|nr:lactate utilization protein [Peptoniphilus sp.]MDY6045181.1 lactate utilization protein [Peptoniphilus sp.]
MNFDVLEKNLLNKGYDVKIFSTGEEAVDYLNEQIDETSVGFGGSGTLDQLGLYDVLKTHNDVVWHWKEEPNKARRDAMTTAIYMSSVNAIAETGEIVNMDGNGNRVASTLFGHEKVYFVIGKNKVTKTYEDAVWRVRNVASPKRAQQMHKKTPCAKRADKCYDCASPERICRGMVTLFGPMMMGSAEVILIEEDYGN